MSTDIDKIKSSEIITKPEQLTAIANYIYFFNYISTNEDSLHDFEDKLALVQHFESINAGYAQYGAAANYKADRSKINEIAKEATIDIDVVTLLTSYELVDLSEYLAYEAYEVDYQHAMELAQNGHYEEAIEIFNTMPDYKDSAKMAEGLSCAEYADSVGTTVTARYLSTSLIGIEAHCEYSPIDYTFKMVIEVPPTGIFGFLSNVLGKIAGEEVTYDEQGMSRIAKDIYAEFFKPKGYENVTCIVEMNDYANDIFVSGSYPNP